MRISFFPRLALALLACTAMIDSFGQNTFPGTGDAGVNTTTPTANFQVVSNNSYLTTNQNWSITQKISPMLGSNRASALFFDNGQVPNCDFPFDTANTMFFIGGPSCRPHGSYWMGFAREDSTGLAPIYATEYIGKITTDTNRTQGTVRFIQNLLVEGKVGIGVTGNVTQQLHTSRGVRFQGVAAQAANTTDTRVVTMDNTGVLHWQTAPSGGFGNLNNSCASTNYLLKLAGTNQSGCSIIYDNGTSVGISTAAPRTYSTSGTYASTVGTPPNGTVAKLDVNGLTFTNYLVVSSDQRFKKEISPIEDALVKVGKLKGVTYFWNRDKFPDRNFDDMVQAGFLAQEVEKVYPEAVLKDEEGYYAMNYNAMIPLLAEAIKEMDAKFESEHAKNEKLQEQIQLMQREINDLCARGCVSTGTGSIQHNELYQLGNRPNPFSRETVIDFTLPETAKSASVMIYNLQGTIVRKVALNPSSGKGSLTISSDDLSSGVYLYSLVVNDKEVATNRMILAKD